MEPLNQVHTASVDGPGSIDDTAMQSASLVDLRRVGKIYSPDEDVKNVIAAEMTRIYKAFDVKLTEHTEHCVNTVNSGKPLIEKDAAAGAPTAQKKK